VEPVSPVNDHLDLGIRTPDEGGTNARLLVRADEFRGGRHHPGHGASSDASLASAATPRRDARRGRRPLSASEGPSPEF